MRIVAVSALLTVVLLFLRWVLRLYFFGGYAFGQEIPAQMIDRIEISAGEALPPKVLLDYLQVQEGKPFFNPKEGLFANDFGKLRDKVLKATPSLTALSISRSSSNTVCIVSTERAPLARFESLPFAIDREGVVFVRLSGIDQLPLITGFPRKMLTPGLRISSHRMMASALELLQCLEAGQSELRKGFVVSVDVSKVDYVICEMTDGRILRLAWKDMGRGTDTGRKWLVAQLNGYVKAIQDPLSRGRKEFDLSIPGHGYAK